MSEQIHRKFNVFLKRTRTTEGKITIFTSIVACFVLVCVVSLFQVNVPVASADDLTTSVTVLNTPPTYDTDVAESVASATTTPTNAGATLTFTVQATDSSGDNYYLLICKTSGAPTAAAGGPTCNGGISNQWAVSAATASGAVASAATTTTNNFPFNIESNDWYGFICDNNATLARCNATVNQGTPGNDNASPFVINHIPVFHSISNNGPINPGSVLTWTSGSYDNDTLGGADTVRLIVCASPGITGSSCTNGGGYASSTLSASNAATSSTFAIPYQDRWYASYVYIVDNHGLAATSTFQGLANAFNIQNVAPSISAAGVSLIDYDNVGNLTLTVPSATSGPFKVQFTVADNNGCINASSTSEIASNIMATYRSGITQANCSTAANYNSNNCYAATSTMFTPFYTCTQDAAVNACSGASDSDVGYTCTFSLWYNADPTDASTQYTAENWLASVRATDDNSLNSAFTEGTVGNELVSFLAFDVSESAVAFGSLQPGDQNDPITATTTLYAVGNVGLDEDIYGDTMCTNWTAPGSCDAGGINPATEIAISYQKVATTTYSSYASATALTSSSSPTSILVNVPKTTSTSSPQSRNTYFGIQIPIAITLAGSYTGQDTITAKKSNPSVW